MRSIAFLTGLALFQMMMPSFSWGHFIWITAGPQTKDGKVHIYFSEDASPDDPKFLDKITSAQLYQLTSDGQVTRLKTSRDTDSITSESSPAEGAMLGLSYDYGVMTRGSETFLLKYHAKCLPSASPQTWGAVGKKDLLPLELIPRTSGDGTVLTVLWQGKPLPESSVTISGPGIDNKLESKTNESGEVSLQLKSPGLYSIRAKNSEALPGEFEGKQYAFIRHYATLTLSIEKTRAPAETSSTGLLTTWPALDTGVTSFGAAIVDHSLYIYGGHLGRPHHYSSAGQSDQLLRLKLTSPSKWEVISTGPKRTGLAAVEYGGKFYRIGGFEARNSEEEKQSLWSTSDFASYDPKTGKWEYLPAMPTARSSHDALVIGSMLYVVGGWELKGEDETTWHDSAYSIDLAATPLEWKPLPKPPFQRRALSLGEWHGKVSVIGGMQAEGGPTTATAFYDPNTGTWSAGPNLNGEPLEGFGSSALKCGDKLCVTTLAGNLQILSEDGSRWVNSGQPNHPRFFHRMLSLNPTQMLLVGGASMKTGKIKELEVISIPPTSTE